MRCDRCSDCRCAQFDDIARYTKSTRLLVEWLVNGVIDLKRGLKDMGDKVLAADAQLEADIKAVADGWAAKDAQIAQLTAERDQLKSALETADADKAAAVAAQAAADDDADSALIAKGDAALQNLLNPAPPADGGDGGNGGEQPPADGGTGEQPPADGGTGEQPPADGGDGSAPVAG